MRHATFLAIAKLSGQYPGNGPTNVKACDWTEVPVYAPDFALIDAEQLLAGTPSPPPLLPDCPHCAVLVDAALESR